MLPSEIRRITEQLKTNPEDAEGIAMGYGKYLLSFDRFDVADWDDMVCMMAQFNKTGLWDLYPISKFREYLASNNVHQGVLDTIDGK